MELLSKANMLDALAATSSHENMTIAPAYGTVPQVYQDNDARMMRGRHLRLGGGAGSIEVVRLK